MPGSRPLTLEPCARARLAAASANGAKVERRQGSLLLPPVNDYRHLCAAGSDGIRAFHNAIRPICPRAEQEATVKRLFVAARRQRGSSSCSRLHPRQGRCTTATTTTATLMSGQSTPPESTPTDGSSLPHELTRAALGQRHRRHRGVRQAHARYVVLGLDAPEAELRASFEVAAGFQTCEGLRCGPHDLRRHRAGLDDRR